jgi:hypothetical protein
MWLPLRGGQIAQHQKAHAAIDWTRNYESLDKELQQIVSDSELGLRLADKLFGYGMFGCAMGIRFPIVKLVDYASQTGQLETVANPFAAVVLAHLKTQETRADPAGRRIWKFRLIKSLYDRALDGGQIRLLFKFLDSMMVLSKELEKALSLDLAEFERERMMPYVSSIERIAREEGRAEGMAKAKVETLLRLLARRFKAALPAEVEARIRSTADLEKLDAWIDVSIEASDLEDFRRMCGI